MHQPTSLRILLFMLTLCSTSSSSIPKIKEHLCVHHPTPIHVPIKPDNTRNHAEWNSTILHLYKVLSKLDSTYQISLLVSNVSYIISSRTPFLLTQSMMHSLSEFWISVLHRAHSHSKSTSYALFALLKTILYQNEIMDIVGDHDISLWNAFNGIFFQMDGIHSMIHVVETMRCYVRPDVDALNVILHSLTLNNFLVDPLPLISKILSIFRVILKENNSKFNAVHEQNLKLQNQLNHEFITIAWSEPSELSDDSDLIITVTDLFMRSVDHVFKFKYGDDTGNSHQNTNRWNHPQINWKSGHQEGLQESLKEVIRYNKEWSRTMQFVQWTRFWRIYYKLDQHYPIRHCEYLLELMAGPGSKVQPTWYIFNIILNSITEHVQFQHEEKYKAIPWLVDGIMERYGVSGRTVDGTLRFTYWSLEHWNGACIGSM